MGEVREIYHGETRPYQERSEMTVRMERSAGIMAQNFAEDLAGYVTIGVNAQGEWSLGFGIDPNSPIGAKMLAGIAIAAIQRDMIIEQAISEALIRNGLVLPPNKGE